ncbi:hypothetical protein RRG08_026257 [Elysia crispata]|uniref:Uncharacterized protein n=1 Tax=Elysia crispata TaxID=231223 RepID=A0AAE0ZBC3_9GAST|nr:hypothetical protein RRG08_026257 [Elysia crispata]
MKLERGDNVYSDNRCDKAGNNEAEDGDDKIGNSIVLCGDEGDDDNDKAGKDIVAYGAEGVADDTSRRRRM